MAVNADDAENRLSIPSEVAVVGSLHLDILVHASQRPRKGETLPGQSWNYKPGGKGGNQAVAAAQFGASVSMISRVGNDDFGVRLLEHLKSAAVDTQYVSVDVETGSGMSVAIVVRAQPGPSVSAQQAFAYFFSDSIMPSRPRLHHSQTKIGEAAFAHSRLPFGILSHRRFDLEKFL